jgi:hypothetical protein
MQRKRVMPPIAEDQIPNVHSYGRNIVDPQSTQGRGAGLTIPTQDPAAK